jgi:hypothetical protein
MINAMIYNPEDRIKSYELISKVWFEWFTYKKSKLSIINKLVLRSENVNYTWY